MGINIINPAKVSLDRLKPSPAGDVKEKEKSQKASNESNVQGKKDAVTKAELDKAVNNSNEIGQLLKRKLNFLVDEATERIVVKVIDEESGETVRQVPPKEMLRISAHLKKLQDMNEEVMGAVKSVILDFRY